MLLNKYSTFIFLWLMSSDLFASSRIELLNYKPIELLYGQNKSKMQLSFAVRPLSKLPVYIAYSQQIYWLLREKSIPIEQTNYRPEIFYRTQILDWQLDLGTEHVSNGKEKLSSRSLFSFYTRFFKTSSSLDQQWTFFADKATGGGLSSYHKYRSLFEYSLNFKNVLETINVGFYLQGAAEFKLDQGRGEVFISRGISIDDTAYLLKLVYSSGYAESLEGFDRYQRDLRIGIEL